MLKACKQLEILCVQLWANLFQEYCCFSYSLEEIMIKSRFSRNAAKLPLSQSSKKPSLASLAQKLQDVDLCSTSDDEPLNNRLPSNSFTDDGSGILPDSGKYTRTSELVHNNEGHVGELIAENLRGTDPVFTALSQPVSSSDSVAAFSSKSDGYEGNVDSYITDNKCGTVSADLTGSWNDCSSQLDRLHINPAPQKRCSIAKPSPLGRTLSAVPNPLNRANRRRQKAALYARFSYFCQTSAVAGLRRQHSNSKTPSPTIRPFDFATPSPDDIVQEKQKLAFGKPKPVSAKKQ